MQCLSYLVGYMSAALALFVPVLLWILSRGIATSRKDGAHLPPVYGPWYLPPFISGLYAMVQLAADEDDFFLKVRRNYGPVVYFPWPLCQTFVLDGQLIQKVYAFPSSTLSFTPIRKSMQTTVFGSSMAISTSPVLPNRIFPAHAKALTNIKLDAPVDRFVRVVETKVSQLCEALDASPKGYIEIGLVEWIINAMFDAAISALFGDEFLARVHKHNLQASFNDFDACFPLLASDLIPPFFQRFIPPIAKGFRGRERCWDVLQTWIEEGLPGLDEGVIKEMADIGLSEGFSTREVATLIFGDLWALQANTPYIAAGLILYVLQSPSLPAVLEEIEAHSKKPNVNMSTPDVTLRSLSSMTLLNSCVQETIRLNTSSYSIRIVEKSFVLPTSNNGDCADDTRPEGFLISAGSRLVCATRASHIQSATWGLTPCVWDGQRFMTENKLAREMNGFGGGISICEGRHLAQAELKALLVLTVSVLDITPLHLTTRNGAPTNEVSTNSESASGIQPKRVHNRPGTGAIQFGSSEVMVRIARRQKIIKFH